MPVRPLFGRSSTTAGLLRTTCLVAAVAACTFALLIVPPHPARADGGAGESGNFGGAGGAGGADQPTGTGGGGSNGGDGPGSFEGGGGGGGGGAGATVGGAGGAGGISADGYNGGRGGDGGVHGYSGAALPAGMATGTAGGNGTVGVFWGGGGGGGAGGYGAVVTGAGSSGTVSASITGGAGGAGGGIDDSAFSSGGGGSGGFGLFYADGSLPALLAIDATGVLRGGRGGDGGTSGNDGGIGAIGGAGLGATNLSIINAGSILGGRGGDGGHSVGPIPNAGGGGGSGGIGISGADLTITNTNVITGGVGGNGGSTGSVHPIYARGSGGAGGAGIAAATSSVINGGNITGGKGGDGGSSGSASAASDGGSGGAGISGATLSIDNSGTIQGGEGGAGGFGASASVRGVYGAGGVGISGSNLSITNTGTIAGGLSGDGLTRAAAIHITGSSNSLSFGNATSGLIGGIVVAGGSLTFIQPINVTVDNAISGAGQVTKSGAGTLTLTGTNSYSGGTTISAGTLQIGNGGTAGAIAGNVLNNGTLAFNRSDNISFAGAISGSGNLTKFGAGTLTLTGTSSYGGTTLVDAGSLIVNGSIATSSGLTVEAGAIVGGSGTLPGTLVRGTISPGNSPGTLTVNGNLLMGAGSVYRAEVQGAVADRITVTGTASLAGTLRLVPLGGAYSFNSPYTLLSAAGGVAGTFSPVDTTGSFGAGVVASVDYTGNTVLLTLVSRPLTPILGVRHPANAHAVASAIDGAVAGGADASPLFNLYNQPANAIPAAVNQLSGEVHGGASALGFQVADQFLGSMLDPNGSGRLAGASGGPGGAAGFTADLPTKRSATGPSSFDPARFSLWGASFGSRGRYEGDRSVGSANRTQDGAHLAVGADILLAPGTVAGVAVAGGRARASLSGGLGKVESDVFQAGLYGRTRIGPLSLGAAIGYARLDNDVQRAVPVLGNALTASYASTVWSGRLQASAQLLSWNGLSLSPLAALQAAQVRSPAFVEQAGPGGNAGALSVAGRNDRTSRSELGVQLDGQASLGAVPVTGFVRASWAHYFERDASLIAGLIALPGAGFNASGARPDRNAALLAAGLDAKLSTRVSLGLRLDSELSASTRSLGGTARLAVSF